ncbi:hypothetical protein LIER_08472 [Lithospermum erythrorhizon]|uniref:Uncharacterized protein n=1 Tax=Lithospermum erythrorhizon TaxID=34254 RepID=A0AAV3PC76_LITER
MRGLAHPAQQRSSPTRKEYAGPEPGYPAHTSDTGSDVQGMRPVQNLFQVTLTSLLTWHDMSSDDVAVKLIS